MIEIRPDFWDRFACKASACRDSCCRGWEIDVDAGTLDYYRSIPGGDGDFVRAGLKDGRLCIEGADCAFLREDGLCELILRLGEDALCDICREHPRFYAENDGICEAGHGLCCEEAARLWLAPERIAFLAESDGEPIPADSAKQLEAQMAMIEALWEDRPLGSILAGMLGGDPDAGDPDAGFEALHSLYASLEVMDPAFPARMRAPVPIASDARWRNLAAYFIYRHGFSWGGDTAAFTAANLVIIRSLGGDPVTDAKDFSKEVEYDEDNLTRIREALQTADRGALAALVREIFV